MLKKERDILPVRSQAAIYDEVLRERLHMLLPELMRQTESEMWIVICREAVEDPIFHSLTPYLVRNASRTSCFIFTRNMSGAFHAYSLSRPNPRLSPFYEEMYDPAKEDQYEAIAKVIQKENPRRVVLDICEEEAHVDGLCKTLYDKLLPVLKGREIVTDGKLAVRWLETRTRRELQMYPAIYKVAMEILAEAYTSTVITPGITTTNDVEWYIMQRIDDMGLAAWFSPDVDVQRVGSDDFKQANTIIQEGDLIRTDMGIRYLCGLHTDTQRMAYVLRRSKGETEIPKGILRGFEQANRFQDIVREQFITGRTGNEILSASLLQAQKEGITAMLYSHPIGLYGHGAGPTIGMFDNQKFIPGHGEAELHDDTCFALELNTRCQVPEWGGQTVWFMIEETIVFTDGSAQYLDDGRTKLTPIG